MVVAHPQHCLRSSVETSQALRHSAAHWTVAKVLEDLAQRRTRTLGVSGQSEYSDPISLGHSH